MNHMMYAMYYQFINEKSWELMCKKNSRHQVLVINKTETAISPTFLPIFFTNPKKNTMGEYQKFAGPPAQGVVD